MEKSSAAAVPFRLQDQVPRRLDAGFRFSLLCAQAVAPLAFVGVVALCCALAANALLQELVVRRPVQGRVVEIPGGSPADRERAADMALLNMLANARLRQPDEPAPPPSREPVTFEQLKRAARESYTPPEVCRPGDIVTVRYWHVDKMIDVAREAAQPLRLNQVLHVQPDHNPNLSHIEGTVPHPMERYSWWGWFVVEVWALAIVAFLAELILLRVVWVGFRQALSFLVGGQLAGARLTGKRPSRRRSSVDADDLDVVCTFRVNVPGPEGPTTLSAERPARARYQDDAVEPVLYLPGQPVFFLDDIGFEPRPGADGILRARAPFKQLLAILLTPVLLALHAATVSWLAWICAAT